jgi:hypothetical protein
MPAWLQLRSRRRNRQRARTVRVSRMSCIVESVADSASTSDEQHRLHRTDRRRRHRDRAEARCRSSAMAEIGLLAISPQSVTGVSLRSPARTISRSSRRKGRDRGCRNDRRRAHCRDRPPWRTGTGRSSRPRRNRPRHQLVELPEQRRHFEHRAELQPSSAAVIAEAFEVALDLLLEKSRARLRSSETSVTIGSISAAPRPPRPSAAREAGCAAGLADRAKSGWRASRAPGFPLPAPGNRARPCRRRHRACGTLPAGPPPDFSTLR